ncbi:RNA methyltransferase, TrmA family [Desulfurella amilsii]|uniref:RNA methyltransferase, TrmA family n=1 Tax=Desulfurella amilsii TaxID=1562698 RepID=A0A1X4XX32_9BACT|nr:RNA methyltransferase, TrmA family [Desulfurella amilsii]
MLNFVYNFFVFETVQIVDQAYRGYGFSYLKNKIIFIPFTIQGEKVKIKITKEKKDYILGEVVTIIEDSKNRKKPFCKYFGICGGCHYQHIHYSEQLNIKSQILKNILKRIGNITAENVNVIKTKQTFYRHRVKFQKKDEKIGFFKQNSNDFLEIDFCPILEKQINHYIKNHKESNIEIDSFSKLTTKKGDTLKLDLSFIAQDTYLEYEMGSFTQVNLHANKELVNIVTSLVDNDNVLEAFCGIGNFTIPLGLFGHSVDAFEIDKIAIKKLQQNAQRLSLKINANRCDLNKPLHYKKPIGTIILDPPRSGSPSLMNFINEKKPKKIIYVSCEPPTLARDISMLKNYSLEKIFLVDMFANTYHFETVAVLSLNK